MTTEDEFHAEARRLEKDLDKANKGWAEVKADKDHPDRDMRRLRLDAAQAALAAFRSHWRQVGAAAPDDHPGTRPSDGTLGIHIEDNAKGAK